MSKNEKPKTAAAHNSERTGAAVLPDNPQFALVAPIGRPLLLQVQDFFIAGAYAAIFFYFVLQCRGLLRDQARSRRG